MEYTNKWSTQNKEYLHSEAETECISEMEKEVSNEKLLICKPFTYTVNRL